MTKKSLRFALSSAISLVFVLAVTPTLLVAQSAKRKTSPKKPVAVKETTPAVDATLPKITQIDETGLQELLKREGENQKPLLVNFWATWCAPCIEEFPDLVKIDNDYKGKIDFITITLDDVEDIKSGVPNFLRRMKAEMPTYLLKTDDEGEAISMVYKDWQGGLPFTIFLDEKGAVVYNRQGKIVVEVLRKELDKITMTAEKQALVK